LPIATASAALKAFGPHTFFDGVQNAFAPLMEDIKEPHGHQGSTPSLLNRMKSMLSGVSTGEPSRFDYDRGDPISAIVDDRDAMLQATRADSSMCIDGYIISAAATGIPLLALQHWIIQGLVSEAIIGARRYVFFSGLIWTLTFTMAIPNSLALSRHAGEDATMSGWIISALMFGVSTGAAVVWVYNLCSVDGSLKAMRAFNFVAAAFGMIGTIAYATMAWTSPNAYALVSARFIAGFGFGIAYFAGRFFINRTARPKEVSELNTTYSLFIVCGLGFGPPVATIENGVFRSICGSKPPIGRGAEYQGMVWCVLFLSIAAFSFPSSQDIHSRSPEQEEKDQASRITSARTPHPHRVAMAVCAIIKTIRDFAIASLEAATAMILEENFGLSERNVGLLLGITFLLTVPLKLAFDRLQAGKKATQLRLLMALCVLGCLLLREDVGRLLSPESMHGRVAVVILADMLLFPAMFLTGAVIEGVGFRLASPEGTFYSTNNFNIAIIAATGLGRSFGPPLARTLLSSSRGQTLYSWQQLAASLAALVLLELAVVKELHALDEEPEVPSDASPVIGVATATPRKPTMRPVL
jgi:hypothetical protein